MISSFAIAPDGRAGWFTQCHIDDAYFTESITCDCLACRWARPPGRLAGPCRLPMMPIYARRFRDRFEGTIAAHFAKRPRPTFTATAGFF